MTKVTAQARHKQSREAALEEMSLQTSAKSRQRGCRCYVLWQTVPILTSIFGLSFIIILWLCYVQL